MPISRILSRAAWKLSFNIEDFYYLPNYVLVFYSLFLQVVVLCLVVNQENCHVRERIVVASYTHAVNYVRAIPKIVANCCVIKFPTRVAY